MLSEFGIFLQKHTQVNLQQVMYLQPTTWWQ